MRELHVSRNTIRKVLRSGETEFNYEREVQRLGPMIWLLTENEAKPARDRLTLIRLFEALQSQGYEGGYDAGWCYARSWQRG